MINNKDALNKNFLLLKKDIVIDVLKKQSYQINNRVKKQFYNDTNDASLDVLYNWLRKQKDVKQVSKDDIIIKYLFLIICIGIIIYVILTKDIYKSDLSIKQNIHFWYTFFKNYF